MKSEKTNNVLENKRFNTNILLDNAPEISTDYQTESDILNYQIKKKGVKNIAVVAGYGAGKSSAIETYLNEHMETEKQKKAYTRVSLASFNDTLYNPEDIERSILQQLLFSRHKRLFPNSEIARTVKTSSHIFFSIMITLFVSFIAFYTMHINGRFFPEHKWIQWIFLILIFSFFFILTKNLIYYKKLKKIKYKDFEFEVKDDGHESSTNRSLINKFIDEVIYFFECSKISLVIFEDLDRLEAKNDQGEVVDQSSAIFVKLRELNTIINNSHYLKDENKVTFVYAIKDDLIKDQEQRGKFFEFILPITAVINPVTTVKKIFEIQALIAKEDKSYMLDSEFIHGISNRIPNMRLLKNTFNDYLITRDKIFNQSENNKLKNENLFAICLYKNLFPFEYSMLEMDKGLIPIILDKKNLVKKITVSNEQEINRLESMIKKLSEVVLKNFEELKMIFKGEISSYSYDYSYSKKITVSQISTFRDLDISIIQHPYHMGYTIRPGEMPKLPNGDTYLEREELILLQGSQRKEQILQDIEKNKKEIIDYQTMKFNEIIDKVGIRNYLNDDEIKIIKDKYGEVLKLINKEEYKRALEIDNEFYFKSHLDYIKFLIQNNYIDENYIEYTSSFQSSLISPNDIEYIKNVQQGNVEFDKKIDNLKNVIQMLVNRNFTQTSILNYDLLSGLDIISNVNVTKYKLLKELINSEDAIIGEYIISFIQTIDIDGLINFLKHIKDENLFLYETLIASKLLTIEKKDLILSKFITEYKKMESFDSELIINYFNESDNYNEILENAGSIDKKSIENFLEFANPKVNKLKRDSNNILEMIVKGNHYKINVRNLMIILDINELDKGNGFFNENYGYIKEHNPMLENYINSNLNWYIKNVLLSDLILNKNENTDFIIGLLKSSEVEINFKIDLIKKYHFAINDILKVDKSLYEALLINNRMKNNWQNIIVLYMNGLDFKLLIEHAIFNEFETPSGDFDYVVSNDDKSKDENDYKSKLFFDIANYEYEKTQLIKLSTILKSINKVAPSCEKFNNDMNLSLFIENDKVKFNETDLKYLVRIHNTLIKYVNHFTKEITEQFDVFFENIDYKIINFLVLNHEIPTILKKRILTQYGDLANVNGFELEYIELIVEQRIIIPINFTMKFYDKDIDNEKKTLILEFTEYTEKDIETLVNYIDGTIPLLAEMKDKTTIVYENGITEKVLRDYVNYKGYTLNNYKGQAKIKKLN